MAHQRDSSRYLGFLPTTALTFPLVMAGFFALPNEMVLKIWDHIWAPADIESFALVSKRVYSLAFKSLAEHRRLKAEYSTLCISDPIECHKTRSVCNGLYSFFKDVLSRPRISLYVKYLNIDGFHIEWDRVNADDSQNPEHQKLLHLPYSHDTLGLCRTALSSAILPDKLIEWMRALESGDEIPIVFVVLTLCPNINLIKIKDDRHLEGLCRCLIEAISIDTRRGHLFSPNSGVSWSFFNTTGTRTYRRMEVPTL